MISVQRYLFNESIKGCLKKCFLSGYNTRFLSNESVTKDVEEFSSYLPGFIQIVTDYTKQFDQKLAAEWFEKVLRYNLNEELPGRGVLTYITFKEIASKEQLSEENLKCARDVAWCSKLIEAGGIVGDDYHDRAEKRRGVPCWYTLPEVGSQFVNDACMLGAAANSVLRKSIGHKDYYLSLLDLFNDGTFSSLVGQSLDVLHARQGILNHTKEQYDHLVDLKIGLFGNYFPIAMALQMSGQKDPEIYSSAKNVMLEIGRAWQMRNDYLDCFGNSTSISSTDIEENKLTWLSVNFMERATEAQKRAIKSYYGSNDPAHVQQVVALYQEMRLDKLYFEEENKTCATIKEKIKASPCERLQEVYHYFCNKIFDEYVKL